MKTFYELKKMGLVEVGTKIPRQIGGQSCGLITSIVFVKIETLGIYVESSHKRSNFKNLELCIKMIEAILEDIT